jgi:hypothetical protein
VSKIISQAQIHRGTITKTAGHQVSYGPCQEILLPYIGEVIHIQKDLEMLFDLLFVLFLHLSGHLTEIAISLPVLACLVNPEYKNGPA